MAKLDINSLLATHDSGVDTWLQKKAQEQPDEVQFAQDFSNLAFQFIQDRAPALMQYIVGFEVVDRSENGTRAVGIFGFKIDGDYYYVPAFFMNSQVKGIDSILSKRTNSFVPLTEEWINYIINRKAKELGNEAPSAQSQEIAGDQSTFENPNFQFLQRPTVGPLGGPRYSAKYASADDKPWKFAEAWDVIRKDIQDRFDNDPEFKASFVGSCCAMGGVRTPFKKSASSPVRDFILKVGGPRAERTLLKSLNNVKMANAAAEFYVGPVAFHVDSYPNHGRDCYLLRKQAEEIAEKAPKVRITSDAMDEDEAREVLEDGFIVHDSRPPEQKSDVIETDYEKNFQNPDKPGVYNVLVNGGKTVKAYVMNMDRVFHRGANSSMVVYFPDNRQMITAKSRDIFTEGGAVGGVKDIMDAAKKIPDVEVRGDYIFISKNGTSMPEYHVSSLKRDKGERPVINGSFSYYGEDNWRPDPQDDFTNYWAKDEFHNRDGSMKNVGSCYISAIELADFTGSAKQVGGTVVLPSDWKALQIGEIINFGSDTTPFPDSTEDKKRRDKVEYRLGSIDSLTLELRKEGAAKLEIQSDTGSEFLVRFDGGHFTRPYGYKQAAIMLVTRLGVDGHDAKRLLKEASVNRKSVCLLKLGQFVGVGTNMPGGQTPESDPYTGIPVYESPYYDESKMPFTGVELPPPDNFQGENIGGDISRQSEESGDAGGEADFDEEAGQLAQEAAKLGQKHVFDKAAIGGLAKVYDTGAVIDSYLPEFIQAVDRLGRVLFLYYWKHNDFIERYGTDDVIEMEDSLRSCFKQLGKLTLDLKRKAVGGGDADADVDTIGA